MRKGRPIPGIEKPPIWRQKWVVEATAACLAIFLLVFTSYRQVKDGNADFVFWAALCGLIVLTVGIGFLRTAQSYAEEQKVNRGAEHDGLLGTMVTIHAIASGIVNAYRPEGDHADLRVTFHRVAPDPRKPTHLEQIVPYVTDHGIEGEVGRQFSANVGITGQAVRMKEPFVMSSEAKDNDEHITKLVEEWAYLRWQAELLTPNRFSAVAAPVLADMRSTSVAHTITGDIAQMVVGVIYLDSSSRNAFDDEEVQEHLIALFDAVADYVTWRY